MQQRSKRRKKRRRRRRKLRWVPPVADMNFGQPSRWKDQ
jgi:hypothetical protein